MDSIEQWKTKSERRIIVNELAARAKTDRTVIPELWILVEQFIYLICGRYCRINERGRRYEYADLCQSAYFAFAKAIDAYDPLKGSFSTLLHFYVRSYCRAEIKKYYGSKSDPLNHCTSLDKPIGENGDGAIVDFLPDETAENAFENLLIEDIAKLILDEAARLSNPIHAKIIRECTYKGRELAALAGELNITRQAVSSAQEKAIFYLRRRPVIQAIRKEFVRECRVAQRDSATDPYRKKGAASFRCDFTSATEAVILSIERWEHTKFSEEG